MDVLTSTNTIMASGNVERERKKTVSIRNLSWIENILDLLYRIDRELRYAL